MDRRGAGPGQPGGCAESVIAGSSNPVRRSPSMKSVRNTTWIVLVAFALLTAPAVTRAEIVEEIVAWVNGEIITLSEYEEEERGRVAEAYRRFSGEELDREVERAKQSLLINLIDRKILVHHARVLGYDIDKMADAFLDQFMAQQNIATREELEEIARRDGMNLDQVKNRLVEMYAPEEVIKVEVSNRVSVSDTEISTFYANNPETFFVEGEVTLREIVLLADNAETKAERRPTAQEIWQRASSGELFAPLAKEFSEAGTASKGGEFGPLKKSDLAETLVDAAFTLPIGGVSELMETPYGFHIIKVDSRMDDHTKPLAAVSDRIRNYLRDQKFRTELEAFLERARGESEWCVKPKHQHLLSVPAPPPCERL
jgi:peptidyl-prolyl cis-trans isomerase SurA